MKKRGNKYVMKESELAEFVNVMLVMELYVMSANRQVINEGDGLSHDGLDLSSIIKTFGGGALAGLKQLGKDVLPASVTAWLSKQNDSVRKWFSRAFGIPYDGPGTGSNADARQSLDVAAACSFLRRNASRWPNGTCAKSVRQALNYGGLGVPHGMRAGSAKDYINVLPANGWAEIPVQQAGQPGDVVVIDACTDSRGIAHGHGHIAMCVGNGVWISDFVQRTMHGLRGEPPYDAVHVYRYKNKQ